MIEHAERPFEEANRSQFAGREGQAPKNQAHNEPHSEWKEIWERRFGHSKQDGLNDLARKTAILKAAIFNAVDPNERPFSQSEQEKINALRDSHQAFSERFEAAWNLKKLEIQINVLAGRGDKRTKAEEEELNRCIVWYSIYRKIYREADLRMNEADQRAFPNSARSNHVGSVPTKFLEVARQQTDQAAETA